MINGVEFWQSIDEDIEDAMIGARPVKAYVGHDDGQRVTLRFQGSDNVGQQRYPRLAGPELAPGTPVYCLRIGKSGRRIVVLGAISDGEWDGGGGISEVNWGDILDKPSAFPPEPHSHNIEGMHAQTYPITGVVVDSTRVVWTSAALNRTQRRAIMANLKASISHIAAAFSSFGEAFLEHDASGSWVAVDSQTIDVNSNSGTQRLFLGYSGILDVGANFQFRIRMQLGTGSSITFDKASMDILRIGTGAS